MKKFYFSFRNKSQQGFTMIELLLYMGIFSILLLVLFQLFASIMDIQGESQMISNVTEDGRFLLYRFSYDIKNATSITTPNVLGSSGSTLVLQSGSTTYTYTLNNGNFMLANSTLGSNDQINSTNTSVSNVSFTRLGNAGGKNTIKIAFTLTSKVTKKGIPNTEVFNTTIGTR